MQEKVWSEQLAESFELVPTGGASPGEEGLFELLCDRIAWLIEHNMEYLLSLLYRNDVLERDIQAALTPQGGEPANIALARLVMERQRRRLETRKRYGRQSSDDVEEDLRW
ncbi:MAG: hypothetical protein RLY31_2201 [Bacteroidota bacterium]|jgi:hypothetical protein